MGTSESAGSLPDLPADYEVGVTVRRAGAGWISAVRYVVRAATAAVGLAAVAALLAGCTGSKSNPTPGAGAASPGFQAYVDCLRQHGVNVNVPSGRPSGVRPSGVRPSGVRPSGERPSGRGGFPGGFGNEPPPGVDQQTWD